jgi:hypothetical protein
MGLGLARRLEGLRFGLLLSGPANLASTSVRPKRAKAGASRC